MRLPLLALVSFVALAAACVDSAEVLSVLSEYKANHTQAMQKRYYVISGPLSRFWPGGLILYCFDASVTNTAVMESALQEAWQLWVAAGADNNFVNFRQGNAQDCAAGNRANILMVSQNTNGALRTSWGHSPAVPAGPNNPGSPGPSMNLDLSPNVAMRNIAGNVAHEIGHAFGMMHEHQRPDLWTTPYPDGNGPENIFTFNCNNLADYAAMVASTPSAAEQQQKCRQYNAAAQTLGNGNTFSAAEFVPLPDGILTQFTSPGGGRNIDLDSIMMYGSRAGGAPQGNTRAVVYTLADGTEVNYNPVPSRRDVNALNAMYGSAKKYSKTMYWVKDSPLYSLFTKFRRDNSGLC